MPDVFVSYSRRDGEFVHALAADLEGRGKSVWIDTQGIGDGEVFPEAIRHAIEQSDAFVFVITPESVASRYCEAEVEYAQQLQKRVVPVLRELVEDDGLPEAIRVRNWIPYTPDVDAAAASERLVAALDTDLEHTHAHTRWLVKALDWESHKRDTSFLLRGGELAEAEAWLAGVGDDTEPAPTALQREYLYASRGASSRRQRLVVLMSVVAVVVALGLATFGLISRSQAVSARDQAVAARANAQSRALAAESETQLSVDPERSILLAMAAVRAQPTPQATYALRRAIDLSPLRARLPNVGPQTEFPAWGPGVAYSPDGQQIAEGSQNGSVQLLDAHTLQIERRIHLGSLAPVVAYGPTGSLLAVNAGNKGTVLLDSSTGARRGVVKAMTNAGIAVSPDGSLLAAAEADPSTFASHLEIWNIHTHHLQIPSVGPVLGAWYGLWGVAFSPDSDRVAAFGNPGVGVFDTRTGRRLATGATRQWVYAATYSPDGSVLATGETPGDASGVGRGVAKIRLLDARTLKPRETIIRLPSETVYALAYSPDGTRIAFGAGDGSFGIYSLVTHQLLYRSALSAAISAIAYSPNGQQIAVTSSDGSGGIYRATGPEQAVIDTGGFSTNSTLSLALTRDRVIAGFTPLHGPDAGRNVAETWSRSGRRTSPPLIIGPNSTWSTRVSRDGRFAYETLLGQTNRPSVRIWNVSQRRAVRTVSLAAAPSMSFPTFNYDGSSLAVQVSNHAPVGGALDLIDVASGRTTFLGKSTCASFSGQTVSDDGTAVAAVDPCGRLTLWRMAASGPVTQHLRDKVSQNTYPLRFSPDGKHLAIANAIGNGDVRIIDLATDRTSTTLAGQTTQVASMIYSPDGSLIATQGTGNLDTTTRVWNARTGRPLLTLETPDRPEEVAFSPDSRTLATLDFCRNHPPLGRLHRLPKPSRTPRPRQDPRHPPTHTERTANLPPLTPNEVRGVEPSASGSRQSRPSASDREDDQRG